MEETKEIQKTESRHDVQIAVMANDMKHISKGIDDMRNEIKLLGNSFIRTAEFENWKKQEFDELKKTVDSHASILLKHTISLTRIMTYGTALVSILGVAQILISLYSKTH